MDMLTNRRKLVFSKKKLPKKVVFSYILDYIIILVLILVFFILDKLPGFRQRFSLNNYSLQYPYAETERVPVSLLVVITCGAPAIIIAIYTLVIDGIFSHQPPLDGQGTGRRKLLGRYRMKDRLWELNCGILGLWLAIGAAFTITGALKNAIGKPRPDVISRCKPKEGSHDALFFGLSNSYEICTADQNSYEMKDGFRSFPSGHASTALAGMWYLSLYLAAKLHVLDSKGEVWKAFVVLIPTLAGCLIAGTRIMDYRHHPFDVITGGLLGVFCAWGSYRQYFPPVTESWRKGRAHPIRSWGQQPVPPEAYTTSHAGKEPLRQRNWDVVDEEQPTTARGRMHDPADDVDSPGEDHSGNVFRQQISASQRRRQEQHGVQAAATNPYTTGPAAPMASTNPFADRQRNDGYWESSSDDNDSDRAAAVELQPQYSLTRPQGPYDPVTTGLGGQDTSYRAQTGPKPLLLGQQQQPVAKPLVDPATDHTGDLGVGQQR